ncbi:hypothetical protein CFP56_029077 [Quercus suber]|uniref:Uncharacterized protein n=1 Tax=Quercus suber TaxID=58331 RepID=A0AAW0MBE0_QUESU
MEFMVSVEQSSVWK